MTILRQIRPVVRNLRAAGRHYDATMLERAMVKIVVLETRHAVDRIAAQVSCEARARRLFPVEGSDWTQQEVA